MSKIIKAVFGAGERTKVCPQWQYDYNTVLQFVGIDLPNSYEVDLSNSATGQSLTVLGDADGCTIPAQFFIPGTTIYAWVYLVGETYGYTRAQVEIPISPRAVHTGDEPTPSQQSALDEAIAALNAATEAIPESINAALEEAKASGEFDGPEGPPGISGNRIWYASHNPTGNPAYYVASDLSGSYTPGTTPLLGDVVIATNTWDIYWLSGLHISPSGFNTTYVGNIKGATGSTGPAGQDGADGYSPTVTVTEITGGHRVTITDAEGDHTFDVLDGQGGSGGTSDYTDLTNKPSIEGVTLSGNKTASDLGLAKSSDIPSVPVQSVNGQTGAVSLTASDVGAGTYSKPSGGIPASDLASAVQTSLGKADTALQSAPVTSVNSQTGAVVLSIPSTAADVGAIAAPSSPATGAFLVWNGSAWAAQSLSTWQGGSY